MTGLDQQVVRTAESDLTAVRLDEQLNRDDAWRASWAAADRPDLGIDFNRDYLHADRDYDFGGTVTQR